MKEIFVRREKDGLQFLFLSKEPVVTEHNIRIIHKITKIVDKALQQ
jgi:hypothetical protein